MSLYIDDTIGNKGHLFRNTFKMNLIHTVLSIIINQKLHKFKHPTCYLSTT